MAFEGKQRIVAHHAAAIVGDADQTPASGLYLNTDIGRACVERVLEQFFYHRRRTLDNLPGRDLIRYGIGEYFDFSHSVRSNTTLGEQSAETAIESELIASVLNTLRH